MKDWKSRVIQDPKASSSKIRVFLFREIENWEDFDETEERIENPLARTDLTKPFDRIHLSKAIGPDHNNKDLYIIKQEKRNKARTQS